MAIPQPKSFPWFVAASSALGAIAPAQQQFALDTPAVIAAQMFQEATTADVDNDGDLDVLGSSTLPIQNGVQLLRNDGAFVFTDVTTAQLPALTQGVSVVHAFDADQDGDVDLFVGGISAPSLLLRNVGGGVFVIGQSLAFASSVIGAASADFDGDGDLDLALSGSALIGSTDRILVNGGAGTFGVGPFLGGTLSAAVAVLDLEGDGDPDLVFANFPLQLWRNDANLVFVDVTASQVSVPQPTLPGAFAVGDLDGDGDSDMVVRGAGPDVIVANIAGVLTGVGLMPPQPSTFAMTLADVDRDGDLDVVRAHLQGGVSLALNDGTATFTDGATRLPAQPVLGFGAHLADLDRDGDPEVVTSVFASAVQVLRNRHVDLVAGPAVVGNSWTVALGSEPGYATQVHVGRLAIGLAALPQPVVLPGFGQLWLDGAGPLLLVDGMIAPAAGEAVFPFAIPNGPALAGVTMHVQGLVEQAPGPARLTAYLPVTIQ